VTTGAGRGSTAAVLFSCLYCIEGLGAFRLDIGKVRDLLLGS
jgi:hypothetical protein